MVATRPSATWEPPLEGASDVAVDGAPDRVVVEPGRGPERPGSEEPWSPSAPRPGRDTWVSRARTTSAPAATIAKATPRATQVIRTTRDPEASTKTGDGVLRVLLATSTAGHRPGPA